MKARKVFGVVFMVLICAILLAAPAQAASLQAGPKVTAFTFRLTDAQLELFLVGKAHPTQHYTYGLEGTVVSSEQSVNGGKLSHSLLGPDARAFAGGVISTRWVLDSTGWRLVTSAPGKPLSGWQGIATFHPWARPTRWPGAVLAYYQGQGFGANRNLSIEWSIYRPTQFPGKEYVFSGLITRQ